MMGGSRGAPPAPSPAITALDSLLTLLGDPEAAKAQLARLEKARADAKSAEDRLDKAQGDHDRRKAELDRREAALGVRDAEVHANEQRLAEQQRKLSETEREFDAQTEALKTRAADLAKREADLATAKATLDRERENLLAALRQPLGSNGRPPVVRGQSLRDPEA